LTLAIGIAIPVVSLCVIIIFNQVEEEEEDETLSLLPNLRIYGVIKVVTIVTTPTIGNTEDVIAPTSSPPLTTTRDSSPLADDIPRPVLNAIMPSYLALTKIVVIIKNFDTNEVRISTNAGTINDGSSDTFIKAPIDMKNMAANTSLNGMVMTLAMLALFDSATNTPAKKAPVATDKPSPLATNDIPKANPRITINSNA
jgi:hypothetical protein